MMSQAVSSSFLERTQLELFSVIMDGLSAVARQALTGVCFGAVGLGVILSVTTVLIGVGELGIGAAGPSVPVWQILHH